jgi:uncharacterized integral membrane protein
LEIETVPDQDTPNAKRPLTARTLTIGVLAVILLVFAGMNLQATEVWPLGRRPVIMIILISFILGALIGWLIRRPHPDRRDGT